MGDGSNSKNGLGMRSKELQKLNEEKRSNEKTK